MPCSAIEPASACTCASSSARTFSGHADLLERDLAPGLGSDCGHVVLLWDSGPARLAGRSPATPHARGLLSAVLSSRQGVRSSGGGSARRAGGVR